LFTLTDIGPEGVGKWFDLYDQCPQGINGLNSSRTARTARVPSQAPVRQWCCRSPQPGSTHSVDTDLSSPARAGRG
jgi:hypothetical protein